MRILPALLITLLPIIGTADRTAREVIETQTSLHTLSNETVVMNISLLDRKGHQEERVLRRLDKEDPNQLTSSLTIFEAPKDIKGTALLTRENEKKPNDQWLYFPSQRRLQRIAQSRRNAYFMGTDFTYEDMDPEKIDDFLYTHLEPMNVNEVDCYVIEAVPANKAAQKSSGYAKRKLWIRKDILFTIKIEFFDRKGKLLKTQTNHELEQLNSNTWRANRSFMDNAAKRHQTEITVISRDTRTILSDEIFTDRHIRTGRYMK
ncbi:outer membrane lipoprotein-sorting protein [Pontiellaceae bacterium B12227]|nr:outer membrane lipoprotein-sorting protein [Pontiellaceae bacterium B12227]